MKLKRIDWGDASKIVYLSRRGWWQLAIGLVVIGWGAGLRFAQELPNWVGLALMAVGVIIVLDSLLTRTDHEFDRTTRTHTRRIRWLIPTGTVRRSFDDYTQITLASVRNGNGEADYRLRLEGPAVPPELQLACRRDYEQTLRQAEALAAALELPLVNEAAPPSGDADQPAPGGD